VKTGTAAEHRDGLLMSIANAEDLPIRTIELAYNCNLRMEEQLLLGGDLEELDLAINRLTCARCHEQVPLASMWFGMGTIEYSSSKSSMGMLICQNCYNHVGNKNTEWISYKWNSSKVFDKSKLRTPINTSNFTKVEPKEPPKPETPKEFITRLSKFLNTNVRDTFKSQCSQSKGYGGSQGDHLDHLGLPKLSNGMITGDLILSGSWASNSQALPDADAAIFFAESWKSKYAPSYTPPIPEEVVPLETVWNEGDNGLKWPTVEVIKSGKPGTEQKPWAEHAPIIYIPWPDHGVLHNDIIAPYVDAAADFIRDGKVVQVGCIGGHGRTGTFAAMVIANLFPNWGAQWALNWVRFFYCRKAAEVNKQEDMVFIYTGEEVPPTPPTKSTGYQGSLLHPPYGSGSSQTQSGGGKPNPQHSYANKK
jgi:hypothetical protein